MKHDFEWLGKTDFENTDLKYKSRLNHDKSEKCIKTIFAFGNCLPGCIAKVVNDDSFAFELNRKPSTGRNRLSIVRLNRWRSRGFGCLLNRFS
jgi:hypothetical protein